MPLRYENYDKSELPKHECRVMESNYRQAPIIGTFRIVSLQ